MSRFMVSVERLRFASVRRYMVSRFMVSVERLRFASVRRYMHGVNVHGVSREAEVCKCEK